MSYTKHIKFIYYKLYASDGENRTLFSLVEVINHLTSYDLKSRIEDIDGNKYRLENIEKETRKKIDFLHLRFMKLDDANIPNLSYENDVSVPLVLENGQYLGTALHILYDVTNEIFMIQQNRTGMTVKKVDEYINRRAHRLGLVPDNQYLELHPIASTKGISDGNSYTKISMNFANISEVKITDNSNLHSICEFYNKYEALTGSIVISLGHHTSHRLNSEETKKLSEEINSNRKLFKNAKVFYKTEDYSGFIDLIENIMHDIIKFDIENRTVLSLGDAQSGMLNRYLARVNDILEELKIK